MAGVRIATVTTISLTTVAAYIGAGGLGQPIFDAIQSGFKTEFLAAGGLAIALAIVIDLMLVGVERAITPWSPTPSRPRLMHAFVDAFSFFFNNLGLFRSKTLAHLEISFASLGVGARDRDCRSACGWDTSTEDRSSPSTCRTSAGRCRAWP